MCHLLGPSACTQLRDLFPQLDVGGGEQVDVRRVGGPECRETRSLPFGLMRGVAAGGHEAQDPAGRVGPGAPRVGHAQSISQARCSDTSTLSGVQSEWVSTGPAKTAAVFGSSRYGFQRSSARLNGRDRPEP